MLKRNTVLSVKKITEGGSRPIQTDGNSATVTDGSEAKVLTDYLSTAHWMDKGIHKLSDIPLRPPAMNHLQITEDAVRLYIENIN